ncbi:YcgL domain-containing protein [Oleiagrimonas sp. C23AA]|uniref:YcgL domain-containing protein n=1 Tax=Oleiagrimonas sp. C23AA TaxID=2719047 RepID=UPI00141E9100|nr:YcgL domain-containing protein [Oleiagrimonas sp. C23AA]NII11359.1 YcgL domain-containing protein [Oleiagrimonas sp. C23AA]
MQCYVFASRRKADTYVWLRERDGAQALPDELAQLVGELRFVLDIDLSVERQLPREDAATVLANLRERGWHLQLPPGDDAGLTG